MGIAGQAEWLLIGVPTLVKEAMTGVLEELNPPKGERYLLEQLGGNDDAHIVMLLTLCAHRKKQSIALIRLDQLFRDRTIVWVPPRSQWGERVPEGSDSEELYLIKYMAALNSYLKRHNLWVEAVNLGHPDS